MHVALVGVAGFGRWHLATIQRTAGVTLVGACDPRDLPVDLTLQLGDVPVYRDLGRLLTECQPDLTVIATPIHTHADLAEAALRRGSHVLLEKPPVTSLADLDRLLAAERGSGRAVEVGFQAMGSHALRHLRDLVEAGELGEVTGIGAAGAWQRTDSYFRRADWAGRRRLNGVAVVDGVLTNPFAHAVMAALGVAGPAATGQPASSVELELFHANEIDSDDTSCLRATFPGAPPIVVAGTLCAERVARPRVVVHGEAARAVLYYEDDELVISYPDRHRTTARCGRTGQLANLVARQTPLCPLTMTRGFTSVVEAICNAPDPAPIAESRWYPVRTADGERRVVRGADEAVQRAAEKLKLFSEQRMRL